MSLTAEQIKAFRKGTAACYSDKFNALCDMALRYAWLRENVTCREDHRGGYVAEFDCFEMSQLRCPTVDEVDAAVDRLMQAA